MARLDESGPLNYNSWRQIAYMDSARIYFLFVAISSFAYACWQLFVEGVIIVCFYCAASLFFLLAWACLGHATSFVDARWSGLLEFVTFVVVLCASILNFSASMLVKDELISCRTKCFAVLIFAVALPGCGYAPRFTLCFVAAVFIGPRWLPQSTLILSPLKLLVAICALCMYVFLRKCARSRFDCLTIAALTKERRNLTLSSRRVLLEKMFDASCICNRDGTVICAASSLSDWLTKHTGSKAGNLCSILDDDQRFLSFLESSRLVDSAAVLLQATLFAGSCEFESVCEPVEVRILCVALTSVSFFLGFSRVEQAPNTPLPHHIIDSTMMNELTFPSIEDVNDCVSLSSLQHSEHVWRQIAFAVITLYSSCMLMIYEVYFKSPSAVACVSLIGSLTFGGCGLLHASRTYASNSTLTQSSIMHHASIGLILQICCRFCLEMALQCVAFHMDSQCVQHAFYCTTHVLFAFFLHPLTDLSWSSHVLFGFASLLCWVLFHFRIGVIRFQFVLVGIITCLGTLAHAEVVKQHMQALACASTDVHRESSKLEVINERLSQMEAAIFDVRFTIDTSTYVAKASTRPLEDFLEDSMLPFYLICDSLQDRITVRGLLDSAYTGNGMEAYVADVMLNLSGRGHCPAKIAAVAQPSNTCQTSSEVLVWLQLGQSDSGLQHHIDFDNSVAWKDDDSFHADDIFPSDSVTSCQETLVWRRSFGASSRRSSARASNATL